MTSILQSRAMLVSLSISQLTGKRKDRKVTEEVANNYDVTEKAGNYTKNLFPYFTDLERIHKKAAQIRADFYAKTLSYVHAGTQILPSVKYFDFMAWFSKERDEWMSLVELADVNYPSAYEDNKTKLKGMFNAEDYPHPSKFKSFFKITVHVSPIPETQNFFTHLFADVAASASQAADASVKEAEELVRQEVLAKMLKNLQHLVERLGDPEKVFRDATVDNIKELIAEIPALNVTDDPLIEELANTVKLKLCAYHPDTLREDMVARQTAVDEATVILNRMMGIMS